MRLDQLLLLRQLASSRTQSQKMIAAGQVKVRVAGMWEVATKASAKFDEGIELEVALGDEQRYVSRAGLKLEGVIDKCGIDLKNAVVLDVGQSTGGFSDCACQKGAEKVVGVDVGHGQLSQELRDESRIVCLEGVNARQLPEDVLLSHTNERGGFDVVVMDVSFISQTLIVPGLYGVIKKGGLLVSLVKPQFEVGPEGLGKGGIVKDSALYDMVQNKLIAAVEATGLVVREYCESQITGGDGNREFFIVAEKPVTPVDQRK